MASVEPHNRSAAQLIVSTTGCGSKELVKLRHQRAVPEGTDTISLEGGNDRFRMVGIKLWGDGSVLLGNVWVSRPYLNNEMMLIGIGFPRDSMNYAPEQLRKINRIMSQAERVLYPLPLAT